jgi:hypothetical protein
MTLVAAGRSTDQQASRRRADLSVVVVYEDSSPRPWRLDTEGTQAHLPTPEDTAPGSLTRRQDAVVQLHRIATCGVYLTRVAPRDVPRCAICQSHFLS